MVQLESLSVRETGVSDRFPMGDVPEKWMQAYAGGDVSTIRRYGLRGPRETKGSWA